MNTITLTMEATKENLQKLMQILDSGVKTQVSETPAGAISVVEPMPVDPPVMAPPADDQTITIVPPAEKPKAEEILYSKSDIREVALRLSKADKKPELARIFKENGGKKLSDFDDKPELYGKMIKEMEAALNA